MRVLWLSGNPSLYTEKAIGYGGGGWIEALEKEFSKYPEIELGISFLHQDDCFKKIVGSTTYYPIKLYKTKLEKLKHFLFYEMYDEIEIRKILKIIDDFKPDLIHIWGTEISFGLVSKYTKIPTVIHLQGILNPCFNSFLIPALSMFSFIFKFGEGGFKSILNFQSIRFWKHNMKRELDIFRSNQNFIGRTNWDKNISRLLAPNSNYFHCGELLRFPFYHAHEWKQLNKKVIIITSVLSNVSYKGIDVILKSAKILKMYKDLEFKWNIFGVSKSRFFEKFTNINAVDVDVEFKGVVGADKLICELLESDVFIHPSYVDNSPNCVCEAQILGVPVISSNIGGISSLIDNNLTGILVPANDPFYLASQIVWLKKNKEIAKKMGKNGRIEALKRHNVDTIIYDLLNVYKKVNKKGK